MEFITKSENKRVNKCTEVSVARIRCMDIITHPKYINENKNEVCLMESGRI